MNPPTPSELATQAYGQTDTPYAPEPSEPWWGATLGEWFVLLFITAAVVSAPWWPRIGAAAAQWWSRSTKRHP